MYTDERGEQKPSISDLLCEAEAAMAEDLSVALMRIHDAQKAIRDFVLKADAWQNGYLRLQIRPRLVGEDRS